MVERLKTICILVLLIVGITQVGVLWSYQSKGAPTGFLFGLLGGGRSAQVSDEIVKNDLFVPGQLVVSDGSASYWVVAESSARFSELWDEARQGLGRIASGEASLTKVGDSWESVSAKRGILVDFGFAMDSELLAWFLGISGTQGTAGVVPDVRKVMINRDILDESMSTFYICSSDGAVYSSRRIGYETAARLEDIISAVERTSRSYTSLGGSGIAKPGDEPSALYAVAPKYWQYRTFTAEVPVVSENDGALAYMLLGNEKDRYTTSRISGNTVQFG